VVSEPYDRTEVEELRDAQRLRLRLKLMRKKQPHLAKISLDAGSIIRLGCSTRLMPSAILRD
jgi:hypothetical protein